MNKQLLINVGPVLNLFHVMQVMIARHKGQELSDDELKEAFSVFDVDDIGEG
jgi:Ca2+-binding EF-hand superfamily protein